MKSALVLGAGKGIGLALTKNILLKDEFKTVIASHRDSSELVKLSEKFSEKIKLVKITASDEKSFNTLDLELSKLNSLDLCINSIGTLHDDNTRPERQISEVTSDSISWAIKVNTTPTLLVAKKIKELFKKSNNPIFASISAKVGSISDNATGGWYSYRISKAALNMAIKNLSIEFKRVNKNGLVVALHPGTTITDLSKPFLKGASKKYTLHSSDDTAANLMTVLFNLDPVKDSGHLISWNGNKIDP